MMKAWAVLGAVLGLAGGLCVHAPGSWAASAASALSGGGLRLLDADGTVWRGSARMQLGQALGADQAAELPGRVHWLVGFKGTALELDLRADCCMSAGQGVRLAPRWLGYAAGLTDGESQWPAGLMAAWGAPWNTLQPKGELRLRTRGLSLEWSGGKLRTAGEVRVDALGVHSRLSTLRPVGSYRATWMGGGDGASPTLQLQTLEGPLQVQGSGRWVAGRLQFQGEASADPAAESALDNLLNMVGRRQGNRSMISLG